MATYMFLGGDSFDDPNNWYNVTAGKPDDGVPGTHDTIGGATAEIPAAGETDGRGVPYPGGRPGNEHRAGHAGPSSSEDSPAVVMMSACPGKTCSISTSCTSRRGSPTQSDSRASR